ncbi:MAG: hypothetical protein KAH44_19870, partial [Oricola sp.]|nr:hypothetical protein [Oricola sp.]
MRAINSLMTCASVIAFATATGPAFAQTSDDEQVDEIIVTGSSIRGVPPTGSNLIGVTREDIALIGAASTPDLLATVPQLNSFNTAPAPGRDGFGSFAPGLRGL